LSRYIGSIGMPRKKEVILPADAMRGKFKLLLLYLLKGSPKHGYLLMKKLSKFMGHTPSPGTVYPALRDLLMEGLIEVRVRASGGRVIKEYKITEDGLKYLEERSDEVRKLARMLTAVEILKKADLEMLKKAFRELLEALPDLDEEGQARVLNVLKECGERLIKTLEEVRRRE